MGAKIGIAAAMIVVVAGIATGVALATTSSSSSDGAGRNLCDGVIINGTECVQHSTPSPMPGNVTEPSPTPTPAAASASPSPSLSPSPTPSSSPGALRIVPLSRNRFTVDHAGGLGDCVLFAGDRIKRQPYISCVNRTAAHGQGWWEIPEGRQLYDPQGQEIVEEIGNGNDPDSQQFQALVEEGDFAAGTVP